MTLCKNCKQYFSSKNDFYEESRCPECEKAHKKFEALEKAVEDVRLRQRCRAARRLRYY